MTSKPKTALITGAGSGIGRAAALALAASGFSIVLTGRRQAPLEQTKEASGLPSEQALVVPSDVCDPASVAALFRALRDRFGRLDLLFNNAGIAAPDVPFEDIDFADWQAVVATNLTGMFLCAQAAFRLMKELRPQGGRIVNNGSISADRPRPNSAPYTATKHAVTGLTKSLSLDGRKYDIACGQIDIGNAASEMTEFITGGAAQADGSTRPEPTIDVRLVGDAVARMASLPLDANVQSLMVMATKMPHIARG